VLGAGDAQAEIDNADANLALQHNQVDYIVTHTAPMRFVLPVPSAVGRTADCRTSKILGAIAKKIKYKKWFFGHFHQDAADNRYQCRWLYRDIVAIKDDHA